MTRDRKEYYKQYYLENKESIAERKAVSGKPIGKKTKKHLKNGTRSII